MTDNTKPPAVGVPLHGPVGRQVPERMKFADVCALMPEGVHWGEHLTPQIARELVEAGAEWQRAQVPALDDAHAMGANGGPALEAEELMREMADLLAAVLGNFTRDDDLPDNLLPRIHSVLYRT